MNQELLEWAALGVDTVGVAVMLLGFVFAVARFVPTLWQRSDSADVLEIQNIRCALGTYLVFALELMIVSDLLHSVTSRKLEDLYFLAALVAVRTAISYFLNREIQEIAAMR